MMHRGTWRVVVAVCVAWPGLAADSPVDIVTRSIKVDYRNQQAMRDYTYKVLRQTTDVDDKGKPKSVHSELQEVLYFGGKPHRRVVEKDGKPLSADDERKEQQKAMKAAQEAVKLTPAQIQKRQDEAERDRQKEREEVGDIPRAFDFTLVGEPVLEGRELWQIRAEPRRDYKGRNGGILRNLHGTLWIDKKDLQWVKVEAESLDTISFGLFLARLTKGAMLSFESQRVNDELWAPRRATVKASLRVALVKKFNAQQDITFSDYRKFRTDSTVTSVGEPGR